VPGFFILLLFVNYTISLLDNISFRPEYYNDAEGQRVVYYHSVDAPAYNGNGNVNGSCAFAAVNCPGFVVAPNKNFTWLGATDVIWHF
jgi:hypothetical protein